MTTSGWVKSTTACAPPVTSSSIESSASTAATSSMSSAASTALQTSCPTLPRAPSTPTFSTVLVSHHAPNLVRPRPPGAAGRVSG